MTMIYKTKAEQHAAFAAPFDMKLVKTRSQGGTDLMYYPVEVIRARLNEVFPGAYDIRVGEVVPGQDAWDLSTILTLRWCDGSVSVIEEWGDSDVLFGKNSGSRMNSPAKNAASDSLKRCCAALGCGAELYNEAYRKEVAAELNKLPEKKLRDFSAKSVGVAVSATIEVPPPKKTRDFSKPTGTSQVAPPPPQFAPKSTQAAQGQS